jgi:uncharacterized protein YlxW (UPF0749 family)
MKLSQATVLMTLICLIIGFMIAIQFQTTKDDQLLDTRDMNEIRVTLQKERERTQFLLQEISKHDQLLYEYELSMNKEDRITAIMEQELERIKRMGGYQDVIDQGFIIRIKPDKFEDDPDKFDDDDVLFAPMVYDADLRMIINELNAYGAKAISINNQRMISTTAIRNVGDRILINTVPIYPPYEIRVIGDHSILIPALKLAGLDQYFVIVSHSVTYEPKEQLRVPAFDQRIRSFYLEPVKEETS